MRPGSVHLYMKQRRPIIAILIICFSVGVLVAFVLPNIVTEPETAPKNTCINNLRLIDAAKQMWASEHQKSGCDMPTWAVLNPQFNAGPKFEADPTLSCPKGGVYTIGAVSNKPTCSVPGHALP